MSGRQLLETLRQLGYPKVDELDSQMFDWLFEKESIVPFLNWFVTNIHSDNVVNQADYAEFKQLECGSREGLLEGRQLEEAMRDMAAISNQEDLTEETLSEDIVKLKLELERNEKKKGNLLHKRNKLSVHHTSRSHRLTKLTTLETQAREQYKKTLDQTQIDNNKVNKSMEELLASVSEVTSLYKPIEDKDQCEAVFLSQVKLDKYYETEEKYTQEVTSFTKKQFFQNIGKMTGEGTRFELLEVKDPESLLVHGEKESNTSQDCKELNRLQSIYPESATDKIFSRIEDKRVSSARQTGNEILSLLQSGNFPLDTNKLSTQLQESQYSLQTIRRDLSRVLEDDIPLLVKELAPLQSTQILTGDYNLKLARQDYFTSNQNKVIELLVNQKARNEFLIMAFEVEARHHRDLHRHLTAIRLQLQQHETGWQNRMTVMGDPSLTACKYQRATLDSRDSATTRLYQMLVEDEDNGKQLFLTYNSLLEGGEKLHCHWQQSYTNMINTATKHYDKLHQLEDNVKKCESAIYEGSSTTAGVPGLRPPQVQDSLKHLNDLLQKLEVDIVENLREINTKKRALKTDSLLTRERTLFVDFFINPARIQQAMDKISSRIAAINVQ